MYLSFVTLTPSHSRSHICRLLIRLEAARLRAQRAVVQYRMYYMGYVRSVEVAIHGDWRVLPSPALLSVGGEHRGIWHLVLARADMSRECCRKIVVAHNDIALMLGPNGVGIFCSLYARRLLRGRSRMGWYAEIGRALGGSASTGKTYQSY